MSQKNPLHSKPSHLRVPCISKPSYPRVPWNCAWEILMFTLSVASRSKCGTWYPLHFLHFWRNSCAIRISPLFLYLLYLLNKNNNNIRLLNIFQNNTSTRCRQKYKQWRLLNVITLGQRYTDNITRMITRGNVNELDSYIWYKRDIWYLSIWINLIILTDW